MEENAIFFASGYVVHALLKKYKKMDDSTAADFVSCLTNTLEGSDLDIDPSPSFEEYTTRWTTIATCGRLCILLQGVYWLFRHIEILLWPFVMQLNSKEASLDKDKAITSIVCNESVQFK